MLRNCEITSNRSIYYGTRFLICKKDQCQVCVSTDHTWSMLCAICVPEKLAPRRSKPLSHTGRSSGEGPRQQAHCSGRQQHDWLTDHGKGHQHKHTHTTTHPPTHTKTNKQTQTQAHTHHHTHTTHTQTNKHRHPPPPPPHTHTHPRHHPPTHPHPNNQTNKHKPSPPPPTHTHTQN